MRVYLHYEGDPQLTRVVHVAHACMTVGDAVQSFVQEYNRRHGTTSVLHAGRLGAWTEGKKALCVGTLLSKACSDKGDIFLKPEEPETAAAAAVTSAATSVAGCMPAALDATRLESSSLASFPSSGTQLASTKADRRLPPGQKVECVTSLLHNTHTFVAQIMTTAWLLSALPAHSLAPGV